MKISEFLIGQDGFRGQLFEPEQKQDKVIIVLMGGEGKVYQKAFLKSPLR